MYNLNKYKQINDKKGLPRSKFLNKNFASGFTLIELLISLVLLSVVLVVGFSLLTTTNLAVRGTQAQRRVMDNLNFALEQMSRSATYGTEFFCGVGSGMVGSNCDLSSGGTDILTFNTDYLGSTKTIVYKRVVDSITLRGHIARSLDGGSNFDAITDERIDIQELNFYVYHGAPYSTPDLQQPRVTIAIRGLIHTDFESAPPQEFFVQTTLSGRELKL